MDYDPIWKFVPFRGQFKRTERFNPYNDTRKCQMVNKKEVHLIRSHSSLGRLLRRPFLKYRMTEGRRSQVVLLDERRLEILIQPKLYAGELLDIVASHFRLKEKEYFGLAYIDDSGHYNWLHLDHRVLDHDFPRSKSGVGGTAPLVLHFLVKFFVEGISQLRNSVTVELFYLQARSLIFKGQIEVDSDVAFELAAHALQVTYGDYIDDVTCRSHLKKVPLLPSTVLKDKPSIAWCEDKVIAHYRKLAGQSRGFAIVNYMSLIEGLPTYGVHYYEVKDKGGFKWWLGLSYKGISQYEIANQKVPKKVFQWRHLENLYFRDRKFSIEVHDPKRITHALSSFNLYEDAIEEPVDNFDELSDAICDPTTQVSVSRRTFGPGNVTVLVWFAANPTLTKAIWSMAISQHQFYLDRKQSKNSSSSIRRLSEIAKELSTSRQSLSTTSSASNLSRSGSAQSLNTTLPNGGADDTELSEAARAARLEMLAALKARKDALEEKLKERTNKLKLLCLEEAEIIGVLPPETPFAPGEQKPTIRRRMGTSFTLPENLLNKLKSNEEEDMASLELEYEIQKRITCAALKLANDASTKKSMRKQRKINYQQSETKLKGIEQKLLSARSTVSQKNNSRGQIKKKQPRPTLGELGDNVRNRSADDGDSVFNVDTVNLSNVTSPVPPGTPSSGKSSKLDEDSEKHSLRTVSQSPHSERHLRNPSHSSASSTCTSLSHGRPSTPSSPCRPPMAPSSRTTSPSRFVTSGYIPSSIYQTRSTYRNQQYPTFSTRTHRCHSEYDNVSNSSSTSSGTFSPLYKNKYDAAIPVESRGLYNVPMQRTSQVFYSQEELDNMRAGSGSVSSGNSGMSGCHTAPSYGRRHHSVANPNQRYGSLDRTFSTVPHTKIESRSLDNLDNPEDEDAPCVGEHCNVIVDNTAMTLPIETHFGAVIGRVTHEYPLSPPSPYEESYISEDAVEPVAPGVAFPNAMQSHLPVNNKLFGLHPQYHYPDMHNQLTGEYLPPRPSYDHPRRSLSHQSLPNTRHHQPQRQNKHHEQMINSTSHHAVLYDNVVPVACNPTTRVLSPIMHQRPIHKTQRLPSPSSSSLSSSEVSHFVPNMMMDNSPKAKEKEWYETSLDSPLSPRRHSSSSSERMLPKSTSPLVAAISPGSPVRACSRSSSLLSPRGDSVMNRFSPSPSSFDQDQSVFLQVPFESTQNCTVVSVGQFQPYREETKPYELSDYYKYSTKVRKQQQQRVDNQQNETINNNVGVSGGQDICNNSTLSIPSPRPNRLVNHTEMDQFVGNHRLHHKTYPCSPVSPDSRRSPFPIPRNARDGNTLQMAPLPMHVSAQNHFPRQNVYLPSLPGSDILQPDESYSTQHQGIYSPPRPMTCEPIRHSPQCTPVSSPTTMRNNSLIKSRDNSFTLETGTSLADAFHDEMLAWYEDQETAKQEATLV